MPGEETALQARDLASWGAQDKARAACLSLFCIAVTEYLRLGNL
jgi:hypothetical protein